MAPSRDAPKGKRRGRRGQRASARRDAASAVHDVPYHVDESRTLAALHGWPTQSADAPQTGLMQRYAAATAKPLRDLTVRELEMLLSQGTDPHFYFCIVLRHLAVDINTGWSGLLQLALGVPDAFWTSHPDLRKQFVQLLEVSIADVDDARAASQARAFALRWAVPRTPGAPTDALCSACLGSVEVDAGALAAACEGRRASTIYASDELAFPGIGMPAITVTCLRCARETVPIAVEREVAESVARDRDDSR